jgi:hypothetical protein
VINLNALLRRRVEYYEYPWTIERRLRGAQSYVRSLFREPDIGFIFSKSMPRSGHRFLTECLGHFFGPMLNYCGFYQTECCHRIPCRRPRNADKTNRYFMQKSHDFGFRDSTWLNGKYLIQYRSPIPRLQSNYILHTRATGEESEESFRAFAETETAYFIAFYQKWIAVLRPNALVMAYEDLIERQKQSLITAISFIQGDSAIDEAGLERMLTACPVGGVSLSSSSLRDPTQYPYGDSMLFKRLERRVADACGKERIRFYFI